MAFQSAESATSHLFQGSTAAAGDRSRRLLPDQIEDSLRGAFNRLAGLCLVVFALTAWTALLTWSFDDPTLTRAGTSTVTNFLGLPGAAVADIFLRGIGLTAVLALLPLIVWGGILALRQHVPRWRVKLLLWVVGVLGLSGAMAALPLVQAWRIPHGYGGLVGDLIFAMTSGATLALTAAYGVKLATLVLLGSGGAALYASLGAGRRELAMIWYGERARDARRPFAVARPDGPQARASHADYQGASYQGPILVAPPAAAGGPGMLSANLFSPNLLSPNLFSMAANLWRHRPMRVPVRNASPPPDREPGRQPAPHPFQPAPAARPMAQPYPQPLHPPHPAQAQAYGHPRAPFPPHPAAYPGHPPGGYAMPQQPMNRPGPAYPHTAHPHPAQTTSHDARVRPADPFAGSPQMDLYDSDTSPQLETESRAMAERFAPHHRLHDTVSDVPVAPPVARPAAAARAPAPTAASPEAAKKPAPQVDPKPARGLLAGWKGRATKRATAAEYRGPSLNMLKRPPPVKPGPEYSQNVQRGVAKLLEDVLLDFGVKGQIQAVKPGPVVTLYELEPARGIKSSRIVGLSDDIARSMSATSARVAGVPGRNVIGIELPNMRRETVYLRELLESETYRNAACALPIVLGKGIGGEPVIADLARMPHVLVAGTTGSGKSVGINAMILSLLYRLGPEQCRFLMIDPKMLELSVYNGIPHLLAPVITEAAKAVSALNWVVREMEERYKRMALIAVRNIEAFNAKIREAAEKGEDLTRTVQTGFDQQTGTPVFETERMQMEAMPFIVVVVDEMADLMLTAGKDIEGAVQRIAQMARAAGIHLIMATQRPSVDVITGTIKANFPTRISFKVTSKIDSRTILGEQGAEQLLGAGDMLFSTGTGTLTRVHGPFVADEEVEQIAAYLRSLGEPAYVDGIGDDPEAEDAGEDKDANESEDIYDKAVAVVLRDHKASTSYIQRRLGIGYNRAASLMERMEKEGLIGPANSVGKRAILVT